MLAVLRLCSSRPGGMSPRFKESTLTVPMIGMITRVTPCFNYTTANINHPTTPHKTALASSPNHNSQPNHNRLQMPTRRPAHNHQPTRITHAIPGRSHHPNSAAVAAAHRNLPVNTLSCLREGATSQGNQTPSCTHHWISHTHCSHTQCAANLV
jgi:hypothetical protein